VQEYLALEQEVDDAAPPPAAPGSAASAGAGEGAGEGGRPAAAAPLHEEPKASLFYGDGFACPSASRGEVVLEARAVNARYGGGGGGGGGGASVDPSRVVVELGGTVAWAASGGGMCGLTLRRVGRRRRPAMAPLAAGGGGGGDGSSNGGGVVGGGGDAMGAEPCAVGVPHRACFGSEPGSALGGAAAAAAGAGAARLLAQTAPALVVAGAAARCALLACAVRQEGAEGAGVVVDGGAALAMDQCSLTGAAASGPRSSPTPCLASRSALPLSLCLSIYLSLSHMHNSPAFFACVGNSQVTQPLVSDYFLVSCSSTNVVR
jgi:hypothetical protein